LRRGLSGSINGFASLHNICRAELAWTVGDSEQHCMRPWDRDDFLKFNSVLGQRMQMSLEVPTLACNIITKQIVS
jgi:hypothetical protein